MLSHKHEIFLEVARLLSFTKASQTLFISQSAISKQIKALEEYYKTGLFERLGNSVVLTPGVNCCIKSCS
ncbi:LysR family transcriptional regulator [Hymenobacter qilianensis]|uniref:LysR family transcriptional regulator n=1 Tax=Hymenobacter qilianensis TaxID=1385715 RepID=UPI001CB9078F|nr:LysR family transcriptional regulator [Hymenobacter qilianensis]